MPGRGEGRYAEGLREDRRVNPVTCTAPKELPTVVAVYIGMRAILATHAHHFFLRRIRSGFPTLARGALGANHETFAAAVT